MVNGGIDRAINTAIFNYLKLLQRVRIIFESRPIEAAANEHASGPPS
jgi:hypothetical protein